MRIFTQLCLLFVLSFLSINCACLVQGENACNAPINNSFHIELLDAKTAKPITRNLRNLISLTFEGDLKPTITKSHNVFVNFGKIEDCSILEVPFELRIDGKVIDWGTIYLDDSMGANAECCPCYLFRIADVVTEKRSAFDGRQLFIYL